MVGGDGYARGLRVVVGGRESLDALRSIARDASGELLVDAFELTDPELAREVGAATGRGHVGVLLDPEFADLQHRPELEAAGARLVEYGAWPAKNHGKAISSGDRAAISTAAFIPESAGRFDLTALLGADASRALASLQRASLSGDADAIRAAALLARAHGIGINDPLAGVATLTPMVEELLGSARGQLLVATKRLHDVDSVRLIAGSAAAGADVTVASRSVRGSDGRALREAGATVHELGIEGGSLHANVIVSDGRAWLGTPYLHHRPLGRGASIRSTREIGVVTDQPAAVARIEQAVRDRIALG
ncbi:MAG: hypothetical protein JWM98_3262 [Thermoleophilia bacterium]|nr:hypothetical protein [Thermoleophilia bacterium]